MRRRRAERCLERAGQAISAGSLDEARAATEEARELDANLAGIAEMDQRLYPPTPPPELVLRTPAIAVTSPPLPVEVTLQSSLKGNVGFTAESGPGPALPTVVDVPVPRETSVEHRRRPFSYSAAALACAGLAVLIAVLFGWRGTPVSEVPPPVQADLRGDVTLPPVMDSQVEADTTAGPEAPGATDPGGAPTPSEPDPAESAAVPTSGQPPAIAPATSSTAAAREVEAPGPATERTPADRSAVSTSSSRDAVTTPPASTRDAAPIAPATRNAAPIAPSTRDAAPIAPPTRNAAPPVAAPREDVFSAPAARDEAPPLPQGAPVPSLSSTLAEAAPLSAAALPSPPPTPAPDAGNSRSREAESAPRVDPQAAVRATLGRYEAAYNGLDVSAARAVWPGVNQQALARAFDGLASQRVAFDNCDVLVNGATARATCSGRAEWTPKVGGGQHRQNRRWAFELANAGGTWQIVRAEAR